MSLEEATVGGMSQPDGTLELDQKPNLRPGGGDGRREDGEVALPEADPFWQRMQAVMWDAQKTAGHVPRSVEEVEAPAAADAGRLGKAARSHQAASGRGSPRSGSPKRHPVVMSAISTPTASSSSSTRPSMGDQGNRPVDPISSGQTVN